jgi:hypothetical protein
MSSIDKVEVCRAASVACVGNEYCVKSMGVGPVGVVVPMPVGIYGVTPAGVAMRGVEDVSGIVYPVVAPVGVAVWDEMAAVAGGLMV